MNFKSSNFKIYLGSTYLIVFLTKMVGQNSDLVIPDSGNEVVNSDLLELGIKQFGTNYWNIWRHKIRWKAIHKFSNRT